MKRVDFSKSANEQVQAFAIPIGIETIGILKNNFVRTKRLFIIFCCIGACSCLQAQQDTIKTGSKNDTTRITLGKKEIRIIDNDNGTDIKVLKKEELPKLEEGNDNSSLPGNEKKKRRSDRFKGHLDGIEFGYNGFVNSKHSMSLTGADKFMSLNTNPFHSMNINVNFCQVSRRLIGNSLGLVTGLRFEVNNYFFDSDNTIKKDNDGRIVCDSLIGVNVDKSKLVTTYFTIPLMLEYHFPVGADHKIFWLAGGVTGSIKLGSHTKVVYHEDGKKVKDKKRDDFNINALRYGFTARAGYSNFFVYGNYYPVLFFETDKGPELYPFSVGVGFHIH